MAKSHIFIVFSPAISQILNKGPRLQIYSNVEYSTIACLLKILEVIKSNFLIKVPGYVVYANERSKISFLIV